MVDEVSIVCLACGKAQKVSLDVVGDGKVFCAHCGLEIPIPVAAPAESISDDSETFGSQDDRDVPLADAATVMPPPANAPSTGTDTAESLLRDSDTPRYAEQETIGKGGMGEIVLCVERNTRRQVAMKRMLPTAAKHARSRARFVEEAQVTAQLEHPNIVPVHDLEMADDGTIYFTMKLVKGRSLEEILTATRDGDESHSLAELLQIFLKVCDGVAFAHSRGVIHRDLKPANIMVGDFGEVLVMDWGIAKILGADDIADEHIVGSSRQDLDQPELYTIAGKAMGSPVYMSPEQAAGDLDKIGPSSDIYSLGAILYEMLTLKRPLTGDTAQAVLAKVGKEQIAPPEQRAPERNIPRELSAVTMKCLSKSPQQRYQSAMGLQRDVNLYLAGRSVSAAPDTFARALVKLLKRNKAVSVSIAAAAVILIAVVSVAFIRVTGAMRRAIRGEQEAISEREAAREARDKQRATALSASKRFAMQAIRAAETGRMDEADRRVKDAESVALDSPWGPYARGMFARTANNYAAAADLFRKALEVDADHAESKAALSEVLATTGNLAQAQKLLAGAGDVTDWRAMLKVGQTLYDAERWKDCLVVLKRALELMEKAKDASKGLRTATAKEVQKKIAVARAKALCIGFADQIKGLAPDEQVKRVQAKLSEINGAALKIGDVKIENGEWIEAMLPRGTTPFLDPLRGLPLQSLTICYALAGDLEPLKGMPLTKLNIHECRKVSDLGPLKGMPLTKLFIGATPVSDLGPLKGMSLRELIVENTAVTDLGPLKGMPLAYLDCSMTKVSDLEPLKGMPLTLLDMHDCREVADLRPLVGMGLKRLDCRNTCVRDLGPLKGMPLTFLQTSETKVTDLGPLKGMPLKRLICNRIPIRDLSPLKGMGLTQLDCGETNVSDLTPLKGMPLTNLHCSKTQVSDLRPLVGMPLTELLIMETRVTDLTPLAGMKLGTFSFTPGNITKGIEIVRGMKTISRITPQDHSWMTPQDFWKKYDAGGFNK